MTRAFTHPLMCCKVSRTSFNICALSPCHRLPHSIMHQYLHADDIVRLVIEETVNLERPSAISLACTCGAFEAAVIRDPVELTSNRSCRLTPTLLSRWGLGDSGIG